MLHPSTFFSCKKHILFAAIFSILLGVVCAIIPLRPPQIIDTPEPLHLKQDEIDMSDIAPADEKGMKVRADSRGIYWPETCRYFEDMCEPTVLEELDQPVVLSVSSSSEPLRKRPVFIPHHKVWINANSLTSSAASSAASSVVSSAVGSSSKSKPLFCSRTGTGSRAEAKKNYCESLK